MEKEQEELTFVDLGLNEQLCEALNWMNITKPTPIQAKAIPEILEQKDIIGCAQTGTGKTAAFLLPVLNKLVTSETKGINTVIIAPTRELAIQIDKQVDGFAYFCSVSSAPIYGGGSGQDFAIEKKALTDGCDIIIATPGRLLSHLSLGYADLSSVQHLILDEADRMLDMGFFEDILRIVKHLPRERQTLLFSATMPPKIRQLAHKVLIHPVEVSIAVSKTAKGVKQEAYLVDDRFKLNLIIDILKNNELPSVIVFCSTKHDTKRVSAELQKLELPAKSFHSDLEQEERNERMLRFKNRSLQILIATDIISRGIDIEDISMVINYNVPGDAEDYVHRVGRTARAASTGRAITFINQEDQYRFSKIERLIDMEIPKMQPPEGVGKGPEWDPTKRVSSNRGRGGKGGKRNFHRKGKGGQRRQGGGSNSGGN